MPQTLTQVTVVTCICLLFEIRNVGAPTQLAHSALQRDQGRIREDTMGSSKFAHTPSQYRSCSFGRARTLSDSHMGGQSNCPPYFLYVAHVHIEKEGKIRNTCDIKVQH